VDGQRLIASQGSAMWFQPMPRSFLEHFYDSVGIDPRQFQYPRNTSAIATGVTPYAGDGSNFGFFFAADARHANGTWLVDPWAKRLEGAPAELIRRHPFGRIAFANSDLSGIMDHRASITEAHRAVQRTLSFG
jgi:hypothetical protein